MRKNFDSRRSAVPRFARGIALVLGATLLAAPNLAHAHFSTVIPQSPNGERGKPLNCLFFWGHPYEHVIFETPAPSSLVALAPSGARATLTTVAEGSARRFRFAPKERGDHLVLLTSPRYEVDDEVLQDHVKVVVHVLTQEGWDRVAGEPMEIVPLTRPYGLVPGTAFQAQALRAGAPLAGAHVEVERYSPVAPDEKDLPPDEFVTQVVKTDPNGVFTATLPRAGWWVLAASHAAGEVTEGGRSRPFVERALLWVHVATPPSPDR